MVHMKSLFQIRDRRIGLILVREQGLDLEVWDGRPCPCWAMGVVSGDLDQPRSRERLGIPVVRRWLLVLPTYLCTTRCVRLPAGRPEEVAAMLEFEVPHLTPCSTQPWTWDFCITGVGEDGTSQVLVVLSPLSVVESALECAHALGLEPALVTVGAALGALGLNPDKAVEGNRLWGQVWWDDNSLDFSAVDGSRLVFLRGVRLCGQNSQGLEGAQAEVGRSLSMLGERGLRGQDLSVRIGGTGPEVASLIERLKQSPPARGDRTCVWEKWDGFSLGAVCDAALSSRRGGGARPACINLLPQHRKEKVLRARRRRELLGIGLRVCVIVLLMLLCLKMSVWRQTRLLEQYQQRIASIAPQAQRLQFLQGQLTMIQTQVQGSVSMLDIVSQMYELLPQEVTIHHLSVDQDRQVVVRAQAKWLSQAFDCIDPLEQSTYLSNVRQSYAHLRELEGQVLIDFELRADLEKRLVKGTGP